MPLSLLACVFRDGQLWPSSLLLSLSGRRSTKEEPRRSPCHVILAPLASFLARNWQLQEMNIRRSSL